MMKIQGRIAGLLMFSLFLGCNSTPSMVTAEPTQFPIEVMPIVAGTPTPTATPAGVAGNVSPSPSPIRQSPSLVSTLGILETVDLRKFDSPVSNQFGGTCSAFATAAAMNNILKQKGVSKVVSERHLWSLYGVYDMDYAISAAKKYYLTEQQYWPVNGDKTNNFQDFASLKIIQTKQHNYNLESALQGLSAGHPLVMAIQVPADLGNCKVNINAKSGYTSGQHVVEAVGYQLDDAVAGGGYFIIKNSWGTTCGDQGYHYYPFGLCKRNDLYCYFAEIVDVESKI